MNKHQLNHVDYQQCNSHLAVQSRDILKLTRLYTDKSHPDFQIYLPFSVLQY